MVGIYETKRITNKMKDRFQMEEKNNQTDEISIKPISLKGDVIEVGIENLIRFTPESLEKAFNIINVAAMTFSKTLDKMRKDEHCPDSVGLEFGVQVDVRGKIFIAEAAANSNFKVSYTWKR